MARPRGIYQGRLLEALQENYQKFLNIRKTYGNCTGRCIRTFVRKCNKQERRKKKLIQIQQTKIKKTNPKNHLYAQKKMKKMSERLCLHNQL